MNKKIVLNLLIILSFVALSFAYFVEFILGHKPCNLCKLERIPYIGSLILDFIINLFKEVGKNNYINSLIFIYFWCSNFYLSRWY